MVTTKKKNDGIAWSNFWIRRFLIERGYSMDHSYSDDREWLARAYYIELEKSENRQTATRVTLTGDNPR